MNVQPLALTPELVGTIAVRRFGEGTPLVLIHGGVGSATHWVANVDAISRHFAVTAIDLPGYGDAPLPRGTAPEVYLEDVGISLEAALPPSGTFGLVGFSFGAVISTAVARRFEGRVNALSLLGPGGFGVPVGRRDSLRPVPPLEKDPAGHAAAVAHNLGSFMLSRVPAPDNPVVRLQSENIARVRFDSRNISFQERLVGDLKPTSCPLQVVWGENDRLAVPSIAARIELIRSARPDAEFHIVPEAGHWVQYEAPEVVDALLIDFHKRVSK
jgi:2-hydroxy-6-oxonona-2,4-dienedioate hydrolase